MKKQLLFLFAFIIAFSFSKDVYANVYASGIRISDDTTSSYSNASSTWDGNFANGGVKIWFIINESGVGSLSATVTIKQGTNTVRTLSVPSPQKGVNSVIWDGYDNNSVPAPVGSYSFEVSVSDPVGHSSTDSLWVAAAAYQGPDPDGGTSYAYRNNASITETNTASFGNLYVARGTSTGTNGFYEFRADGQYVEKIGTMPMWVSNSPTEVSTLGNTVWGLAGYGFTNAGYVKGYNSLTDNLIDSSFWGTTNVRGLYVRYEGADTAFYTLRSGSGLNPAIIKKTGVNGDTSTVINMAPYITAGSSGYLKGLVIDDGNNFWVIYGNSSATRNRIARFNSLGVPFFDSSLVSYGLPSNAIFQSIALDRGASNSTATDDKVYLLIYGGATGSPASGIYRINQGGETLTQLVNPNGITSAATSQFINVDKAGNIIWSNGSSQERMIAFSPAAGPNSFTTQSPSAMNIVVTQIVPVELTAFSASVTANGVQLIWETATELNNSGFEVQKKINGNWEKIAFVSGYGTSTEIRNYSFVDEKAAAGKLSYRLKQIDFDGTFSYSNEIEVDVNVVEEFELSQNYPNPFNPSTTIKFKVPVSANVNLSVYAINGELVEVLANGFMNSGSYEVSFDASKYASGNYVYRLTSGNIVLTKKMSLVK